MMQNGVGEFMGQRHAIATYANFCAIANTSLASNRYNAFRELSFGVDPV
jgi:hypothetical protein